MELGFDRARLCFGLLVMVMLLGQGSAGMESQRAVGHQGAEKLQKLASRRLLTWDRKKCVTCPSNCNSCSCTACGTCSCISCPDGYVWSTAGCVEIVSFIRTMDTRTKGSDVIIVQSRQSYYGASAGRTFGRWMILGSSTSGP